MKKQALFSVGVVLGGCLWFAISGYGRSGHNHDHGSKESANVEVVKAVPDFILDDEVKTKLEIEVGTVEMPDIPGSSATVIAVPAGAISNPSADGGKAIVYFTEDSGKDRAKLKFVATEVEIGEARNGYVEIISGLLPGDVVIVKNAARIARNGAGDVADIQGDPTSEETLNPGITKQFHETAEVESEQVESAKRSVKSSASHAAVVAMREEACDSRCPYENLAPQSFCPNEPSHSWNSSHCDRDEYRRGSRHHRPGGHHW